MLTSDLIQSMIQQEEDSPQALSDRDIRNG